MKNNCECLFYHIFTYLFIQQSTFDFLLFPLNLLAVIAALLWPFTYCYFANITTDRIASFAEDIYGSNWYEFPLEFHQYIILIIARSKKPCYFTGLNFVRATLETFGIVWTRNLNESLIVLKYFDL